MYPVYQSPDDSSNSQNYSYSAGRGRRGTNFPRTRCNYRPNHSVRSYSPRQNTWNSASNQSYSCPPADMSHRGARYHNSSNHSFNRFPNTRPDFQRQNFQGTPNRFVHHRAPAPVQNDWTKQCYPESFHSTKKHYKSHNQKFFQEKILYIIRGAPGSGKTTLAEQLNDRNGIILSTDDYFQTRSGYFFEAAKLRTAHDWNKRRADDCMREGKHPVIIDNTNMESWEMKPYMLMALEYGYKIEIVEPATPWKFDAVELSKRNLHGVSREGIERMLARYEPNVTVEGVLGRESYGQYQKRCLGGSEARQIDHSRPQPHSQPHTPRHRSSQPQSQPHTPHHRSPQPHFQSHHPRHRSPYHSASNSVADVDSMMSAMSLHDSGRTSASRSGRGAYRLYDDH